MKFSARKFSKRKSLVVGAAICVAICLGLLGWFGRPAGEVVQGTGDKPGDGRERPGSADDPGGESDYIPNELVGIFKSKRQAQEAARLYGIELISYSNQVAVFRCEGDPKALIEEGERNGWPALSLNHIFQAFG